MPSSVTQHAHYQSGCRPFSVLVSFFVQAVRMLAPNLRLCSPTVPGMSLLPSQLTSDGRLAIGNDEDGQRFIWAAPIKTFLLSETASQSTFAACCKNYKNMSHNSWSRFPRLVTLQMPMTAVTIDFGLDHPSEVGSNGGLGTGRVW